MYIIFLKFAENRKNAAQYLAGHKKWLSDGIEDGTFLMAGSLGNGLGGAVLALNEPLAAIQSRVKKDPFVKAKVVAAEIYEYMPSVAGEKFQFLMTEEAAG